MSLEGSTGAKLARMLQGDALNEWRKRASFFPSLQPLAINVGHVAEQDVPEPYNSLLVHNNHMTKAMENFHRSPMDVRVLERFSNDRNYTRAILLVRQDSGAVAQFAIAQLNLDAVSESVRRDILSEQIPMGRVLLSHKVACRIELDSILKVTMDTGLSRLFCAPVGAVTYARLARIFCDSKPGFDVLEVSAPV
jgi:chorismate-pyruvate lyase